MSTRFVYCHGIGNKLPQDELKSAWDLALFGQVVDFSEMAYWVDRDRYPTPETSIVGSCEEKMPWRQRQGIKWLRRFHARHGDDWIDRMDKWFSTGRVNRPMLKRIIRWTLPDVWDFLFEPEKRLRMLGAVARAVGDADRVVVVGHSLGSAIAYKTFVHRTEGTVPLFLTIGSPLGLSVFSQSIGDLVVPPTVKRWVNVAERLDPVCVDADLADDVSPPGWVEDHEDVGINPNAPAHPHSVLGYLRSEPVQRVVDQLRELRLV